MHSFKQTNKHKKTTIRCVRDPPPESAGCFPSVWTATPASPSWGSTGSHSVPATQALLLLYDADDRAQWIRIQPHQQSVKQSV